MEHRSNIKFLHFRRMPTARNRMHVKGEEWEENGNSESAPLIVEGLYEVRNTCKPAKVLIRAGSNLSRLNAD